MRVRLRRTLWGMNLGRIGKIHKMCKMGKGRGVRHYFRRMEATNSVRIQGEILCLPGAPTRGVPT